MSASNGSNVIRVTLIYVSVFLCGCICLATCKKVLSTSNKNKQIEKSLNESFWLYVKDGLHEFYSSLLLFAIFYPGCTYMSMHYHYSIEWMYHLLCVIFWIILPEVRSAIQPPV